MESAIALIFLERQGSKMAAKTGRRFVKEFQGALMLHKLYKDPGILSETLEEYKSIFKNSTKKKLMETNTVLPIDLNELGKGSMHSNLGIEITEITSDIIRGIMPVDQRTCQPFGILHGGASMVLAETLGSYGSYSLVDRSLFNCVGLEINANHVRSVTSGYVYGKATIVHKGRTTHIWTIEIVNEYGKLVCTGRITIAIIAKSEKQ